MSDVDYAHSARANNARLVKADKLASLFAADGGTWPASDAERRAAERAAGVRVCSEETWDLARLLLDDLLESRRRADAGRIFRLLPDGTREEV